MMVMIMILVMVIIMVMEMSKMTEIQIIGSSGLCRHSGVPDLPEPRGKHFFFCTFFNLIELINISIYITIIIMAMY